MYLIYYSPWKWSMLNTALNRYDVEEPEIIGRDLMQLIKENRHDLGLDSKHGVVQKLRAQHGVREILPIVVIVNFLTCMWARLVCICKRNL